MVKMCGAEPVFVPTYAQQGYTLTPSALSQTLAAHPRATCLILCNPSNPTGCNIDDESLHALALVLEQHPQLTVISDEIYERLVYDQQQHVSLASLASPALFDRIVTVNGFSKSHAMTGYRVGYCATSKALAKEIGKLQSQTTSCASSISQAAALAALTDPAIAQTRWLETRVQELQSKRDLALSLLQEIPHVSCPKPSGAFYLLPDVQHYFDSSYTFQDGTQMQVRNSHELSVALLKAEGVALVAGEAFGDDRTVRLSYATSKEVLTESLKRLKRFLLALQK